MSVKLGGSFGGDVGLICGKTPNLVLRSKKRPLRDFELVLLGFDGDGIFIVTGFFSLALVIFCVKL